MRYVVAEGGFPNTGHGEELLVMRYPDTMRFWPICKSDGIVLQKADRLVPREGNAVVELPMPRPRPPTMAGRRKRAVLLFYTPIRANTYFIRSYKICISGFRSLLILRRW